MGGRAVVIVPDGVLFSSSKAHKDLRKILVEDQKLDGIISMPSGVFKPYAEFPPLSFFTKTNSGGTGKRLVLRYAGDGLSLDDKRTEQETSDLPRTFSNAGKTAMPRRTVPAPSNPSSFPSPRSLKTTTTYPSTATRKSNTRKSSTTRRRKF